MSGIWNKACGPEGGSSGYEASGQCTADFPALGGILLRPMPQLGNKAVCRLRVIVALGHEGEDGVSGSVGLLLVLEELMMMEEFLVGGIGEDKLLFGRLELATSAPASLNNRADGPLDGVIRAT